MVTSRCTESIDKSILWKKERERKDANYDEVVIPAVEKIVGSYLQPKLSMFRQKLFVYLFGT